jgi:uncharacterized protein YqgC (DUF456 family)
MFMTEVMFLAAIMAFAAPFVGMIEPAMGVALVFWVGALVTMELGFRRWEAWKNYDDDDGDESKDA